MQLLSTHFLIRVKQQQGEQCSATTGWHKQPPVAESPRISFEKITLEDLVHGLITRDQPVPQARLMFLLRISEHSMLFCQDQVCTVFDIIGSGRPTTCINKAGLCLHTLGKKMATNSLIIAESHAQVTGFGVYYQFTSMCTLYAMIIGLISCCHSLISRVYEMKGKSVIFILQTNLN